MEENGCFRVLLLWESDGNVRRPFTQLRQTDGPALGRRKFRPQFIFFKNGRDKMVRIIVNIALILRPGRNAKWQVKRRRTKLQSIR